LRAAWDIQQDLVPKKNLKKKKKRKRMVIGPGWARILGLHGLLGDKGLLTGPLSSLAIT
jgi:hypothetical protein